MTECNPIELSRAVRRAEEAAWSWHARLREWASPEDAPLNAHRTLLSHEQFEEVSESLPEDDPLRAPLLRWLSHLLEQRVNQSQYTHCAQLRYHEPLPVDAPLRTPTTIQQSVLHLLDDTRRGIWLSQVTQHSSKLSATELLLWQRRLEVSRRLGHATFETTQLPCPTVYDLAEWVLNATQPFLEGCVRELKTTAESGLPQQLELALSPIGLSFPTHLNPRVVASWFRETRLLEDINLRAFDWPEPIAPASFALALDRFGFHLRGGLAPSSQPFIIAHDSLGLEAHTMGWLCAGLLANPAFQQRHLAAAAQNQRQVQRGFAQLGLLEVRLRAVKVLLRRLVMADHRRREGGFEELTVRWLGQPLSHSSLAVLPRLSLSDPQRLCAVGLATQRRTQWVEAHNADWFRNPRAIDQLRSEANLPPAVQADPELVRQGLAAYISELEQALG